MKKKQTPLIEQQRMIAFEYRENLDAIVRDLQNIDLLIPRESSRCSLFVKDGEAQAIIEARKNDLLGYIQTICRDHIRWSEKLLKGGWTPEQRKARKP
jgi:hypothetical protein